MLVSGAACGIGRATAARLADAGQVAAARRAPALDALATEHPNARPIVRPSIPRPRRGTARCAPT